MQNRIGSRVFLSLGITCLTVLLAVSLAVGVTYGRYSTLIQGQMALTAMPSPEPVLYSLDEEGNLIAYASQWLTKGGEQYHTFVLRNGSMNDSQPPKQTIRIRIRVFVPDDRDTMGALSFTLSLNNGAVLLSSGASYLGANAPYYTEGQTEGWVYGFYQNGVGSGAATEYTYTFGDGAFEALPITVTVQNTTIDCSSFRICVERVADGTV